MKKFFKNATLIFLIVAAVISLVACGGGYSVDLGIGDGNKENDRVSVKIPKDKIKLKLKAVTK